METADVSVLKLDLLAEQTMFCGASLVRYLELLVILVFRVVMLIRMIHWGTYDSRCNPRLDAIPLMWQFLEKKSGLVTFPVNIIFGVRGESIVMKELCEEDYYDFFFFYKTAIIA